MLKEIWDRWRESRRSPSHTHRALSELPGPAAHAAVIGLMAERPRREPETLQGLVIRRAPGGWCLHAALGGHTWYCGADRRWVYDIAEIGNPFRTFAGVEWYLQEWRVG